MDKSTILKGFNGQFEEFMEDIELLFPENKDIKTSKTALGLLRKANPKKVISVWDRYICKKYYEQINNEDIDFFLSKDYSGDLKMDEQSSSKIIDGINNILEPIKELDDVNKRKCFQYLKNLNELSKIYYS